MHISNPTLIAEIWEHDDIIKIAVRQPDRLKTILPMIANNMRKRKQK